MATNARDSARTTNGVASRKTPARPRKPVASKTSAAKALAGAGKSAETVVDAANTAAAKAATKVASVAKQAKAAVKPVASRPATPARPARSSSGVGAGTVLGVAAAGIAAGLVANLGRKAAVQAPSVMAGDWMEALKTEHKAALTLIDQLAATTTRQSARRTMLLAQLRHALGKHAFTEENVIYPALREWGDKADADQLNHEHGYVKQWLYELEGMDKTATDFAAKVKDFRADLDKHIREEEDKIFPQLHKALDAEKNKKLTALANREGFKLA
jgi:hemerythrin-like domain-containing protein